MTVETQALDPRTSGEVRLEFFGKNRGEVAMKAEEWRKEHFGHDASTSATYKRKGIGRAGMWCVIGTRRASCD